MRNDYLILLDLDGSLLTSKKKIPYKSKIYLRKLKKEGYKVAIASGRPARNIVYFYKKLKLDTPIIAINGVHIHYPEDPNKDKRTYYDKNKIIKIVNKVKEKFEIRNIIFETDTDIYITNKDRYMDKDFWMTNMKVTYDTLENILKNDVMTFFIELDKDYDKALMKEIFKDTGCEGRFWLERYEGYIEIFEKSFNKGLAALELAKELNIKKENIIAFGDDLNDIDLVKLIPNTYVMKNSTTELKEMTNKITKFDNNEEGIRKELEVILKNLK